MIIPPIVGVPFFCICPVKPKVADIFPNLFFAQDVDEFLPNVIVISKERNAAIPARNEMY